MTAGRLYGSVGSPPLLRQGSSGQLKARSSAVHRSAQSATNSRMLSAQAGKALGKMLLIDAAFNVGMKQTKYEVEVGSATHTSQAVVV